MEKRLLLSKFFRSPHRVGSITPSSKYLAKAILRHVDWEHTDTLIELGAGTGIFTRYIDQYIKPDTNVLVFEQDKEMRERLKFLYPKFQYFKEAKHINRSLKQTGVGHVDCVISGLPFAIFPQQVREEILDGVFHSLRPGGLFIAFQYSLQMKKNLKQRFERVNTSFIPINIPPAFVYVCKKAIDLSETGQK